MLWHDDRASLAFKLVSQSFAKVLFSKGKALFCFCVATPLGTVHVGERLFRRSSTESHKYMWVCVSWRHLEAVV